MLLSVKQQRDLEIMWGLHNSGWTQFRTSWGRGVGGWVGKHKTVQDKTDLNKFVYDMKDFYKLQDEYVWLSSLEQN